MDLFSCKDAWVLRERERKMLVGVKLGFGGEYRERALRSKDTMSSTGIYDWKWKSIGLRVTK